MQQVQHCVRSVRDWRSVWRQFGWQAGIAFVCALTLSPAVAQTEKPLVESVILEADVGSLPASEKAALKHVLGAARIMDALFIRQLWPGTAALIAQRQGSTEPTARNELDAMLFFKGPWRPDGHPFVKGVPPAPLPFDFFPADATKSLMDEWIQPLPPAEREHALAPFTAIRKRPDGKFEVVPYSTFYGEELRRAADELSAAAQRTAEPSLKDFLRKRAAALLDDDYFDSDVSFVRLSGPIDVVLGPYEVDNDDWFGAKTSFEASVALVNGPATRRVASVTNRLQELEDNLPLDTRLRGRKLAAAQPPVILDAIYLGGLNDAAGQAAGYGLPNDVRVQNSVGTRTGTFRNVLEARYRYTFRPIAAVALTGKDQAALRFDDILDEILFVRLFDGLGPQTVVGTSRPIADAMGGNASVAFQIRSMLLSLWGHRYLVEKGHLESVTRTTLYAAFLVPALGRIRSGAKSPQARGSTYVLSRLIDAGAFKLDGNGRFEIDAGRADGEIRRAAAEFVGAMADGDAKTVTALMSRYGTIRPEVTRVLEKMGPEPAPRRAIYRTADLLTAGP